MAASVSLSFRVAPEKAETLDRLAETMDRPRSWLLEQALDAYLHLVAWQVREIELGIKDVEEGRVIPHEEVEAWARSWIKRKTSDAAE